MRLPAACLRWIAHRNGRPGATGGGNGCLAAPGLPARLSRRLSAHSGYRSVTYVRIDPPAGGVRGYAGAACAAPSSSSWGRRRSWTAAGACAVRASTRLASELVALQLTGTPVCVVSSGAIALGLGALEREVRPSDVPSLQAASAVGQGLLAGAWQRALASAGGRAAQVLLTADDVRRRTSYLNARATLEALLAWDVVPIVNENDSTATDEITFGDNDALAAQVALLLRARLLVLLTDAEGLYTRDPRADGRRARARGARSRAARRARPRRRLPQRPRLGRHALEGRGGVDGGGRRRRLRDRLGRAAGHDRARRRRAGGRARASRAPRGRSRPGSCGCATASRRRGASSSSRRAHGAALARREPAAGGRQARRGEFRAGRRSARVHARGRGRSRPASWPWGAPSCAARRASTRPSPGSRRPFIAITWSSTMAVTTESASTRARAAARTLATLGRGAKDAALEQIALAIERDSAAIVEANAEDLAAARASGQSSALLDRLTLDSERVLALCDAVRAVAALDDPVGEVVTRLAAAQRARRAEGARAARRPAGRLRGAPERDCRRRQPVPQERQRLPAARLDERPATNAALLRCVREASRPPGSPRTRSCPLEATREELAAIVADPSACDVVIPRGGEALKTFLLEHARVPVLVAAGGNCHVYLHADADPAKALPIVINAKTQRPASATRPRRCSCTATRCRCSAPSAPSWPNWASSCAPTASRRRARRAEPPPTRTTGRRVPRPRAGSAYRRLGRGGDRAHRALLDRHSEAIVTESLAAADAFVRGISSACVYVNASTRFTDGGEFGFGAEIGNSTARCTPAGRSAWPTHDDEVRRARRRPDRRLSRNPPPRRGSGAGRRSRCGRRGPSSSRARTRGSTFRAPSGA